MKQIQITKEEFRNTEGLLYRYFEQPREIERIKHHIALLEEQAQDIEKRIHETNVNVDTSTNMGIDYSRDKIQTSSQGSYAEMEVCRQVQKLIDREDRKKDLINELLNQVEDINEINQILHDNLKDLNEECKQFIRHKYKECRSCDWIALEMYRGARATAFRRRNEIVEDVFQWLKFTKT